VRIIGALLAAVALIQPAAVLANDQPRRLADYTHQSWTEESGAPAPVLAIAQGRKGLLWLATGEGLYRFDGMSFERIEPHGTLVAGDYPTTVFVARNGDVWTYFKESRRFAIYHAGVLHFLDGPPAVTSDGKAADDDTAWIITFAEGADGAIWALTANFDAQALRFKNGEWERFDAARGLQRDNGLSMVVADDGAVWISQTRSVSRLAPGGTRFELFRRFPHASNSRLSVDPDGRIWTSERRGSYPLTGAGGRGAPPSIRAYYPTDDAQIRGAPLFDRAGNLWIATLYDGVQRVASADPRGPPTGDAKSLVETFHSSVGLSSEVTKQIFEDREGDLWVGTEMGLDEFRPAKVRFEPALTLPAAFGDKLTASDDGSVYIGEARAIYRVRPGGEPEPVLPVSTEPQSICQAPDGALGIVLENQVIVWKNGRILQRVNRPNREGISYDCAFDKYGAFWYSSRDGGLNRYRNGRWDEVLRPAGGSLPTTLERDAHGGLIVQYGRQLAWIDGPAIRFTPLDFGAGDPKVLTLYGAPNGDVFAAGIFGLTRYRKGRSQTIWAEGVAESNRINGVVLMPDGDIWLAYPSKLARIGASALERAFKTHKFPPPEESLGAVDGLTSGPNSHSQRSLVRGGDGRLWIATESGTLSLPPERSKYGRLPPGVAVTSLTVDNRAYRDPGTLELAAAPSHIEIDYAVLSFADPRHAKVRYRLEGYDQAWIDPGTRRQAFYTNLAPGTYRFRVIGANDEGVWNRAGSEVSFEIPPTFVQSRWFFGLCIALALIVLWLAYRLRMAQVARRIRTRLEERLGERERIARELHDTLLQSVQGLILRFQSVANRMPPDEPSRTLLESALKRADDVIIDGRNSVRGLRAGDGQGDLLALLRELVDSAGFTPPIPVRAVVEGRPRPLHPLVVTEIRRIVAEALFNVARHAQASSVDVAITFGDWHLDIEIRDDGVGIAEPVLARGEREGHFGLVGMRERAQRIGGTLTIDSRARKGTDVMLRLPARLAYAHRAAGWRSRFSRGKAHRTAADG
jgi:signal transduction histidine kinase/ligand-binding sensor domain-containing protein